MKEVIKFAKFYLDNGYSIDDAITMAINIIREVEISKYEYWWFNNILIKT